MNSFGIHCFNELKMVYWTSNYISCKKEIFWITKTIKIANSYSAKMVGPNTELISIFPSIYYIPKRIPLEFIASMNLKWCIGHRLIHPVRKKYFG